MVTVLVSGDGEVSVARPGSRRPPPAARQQASVVSPERLFLQEVAKRITTSQVEVENGEEDQGLAQVRALLLLQVTRSWDVGEISVGRGCEAVPSARAWLPLIIMASSMTSWPSCLSWISLPLTEPPNPRM